MNTCDISKVEIVSSLLGVAQDNRPPEWLSRFLEAVSDASFACGSPQVFLGPDGFPYFALLTPEPYKPFEAFCLCRLAETAVERGFGAAINPQPGSVDWVFSCGDLLGFHLQGDFRALEAPPPVSTPVPEAVAESESVLVGQPAESYLPSVTRGHIRGYLSARANVEAPGILLMSRPSGHPSQQLVFSVYRRDFPSDDSFRSVLQGISWYLPRNYVVVGPDKPSEALEGFEPL